MKNYPKVAEINVETGETVVREKTDEEKALYDADQMMISDEIKAAKELESQRLAAQAKLEAIGLTANDLKVLGL